MRWTLRIGVLLILGAFLALACGTGVKKMDQQELDKKLAEIKANAHQEKHTEIAMTSPATGLPAPTVPGAAAPGAGAATVHYEPFNRPDPFVPYKPDVPGMMTDNPLLRYEVRYFKLVGIVHSGNAPVAIFEDPNGRSYDLRVGDPIGKNNGVVKAITNDQVIINETKASWTEEGTETVQIVIWLRPEEHVTEH